MTKPNNLNEGDKFIVTNTRGHGFPLHTVVEYLEPGSTVHCGIFQGQDRRDSPRYKQSIDFAHLKPWTGNKERGNFTYPLRIKCRPEDRSRLFDLLSEDGVKWASGGSLKDRPYSDDSFKLYDGYFCFTVDSNKRMEYNKDESESVKQLYDLVRSLFC